LATVGTETAQYRAFEALLRRQATYLDLQCKLRQAPALAPDPTAPELPKPASLEEANAQISLLIERNAEDLDHFAEKMERERDQISRLTAEHRAELIGLKEELSRKDAMLDQLNQALADMHEKSSQMTTTEQRVDPSLSKRLLRRAIGYRR